MRTGPAAFLALGLAAALLTGACADDGPHAEGGESEDAVTPIDRLAIGRAAQYPADRALAARSSELAKSQRARREAAWQIVARALEPVGIKAPGLDGGPSGVTGTLPRVQTFYSKQDFLPMFDQLFRGLSETDRANRAPFGEGAISAIFPWNETYAKTLASWTDERYRRRLQELADPSGVSSLTKDTRVLMSPALVGHLLANYKGITDCLATPPPGDQVPPADNFASPCLAEEFPADSVAIKLRWVPGDGSMATYDTTAASVAKHVKDGSWGEGDGTTTPAPDSIYSMRIDGARTMRLGGIHIATKELRDWSWITLWWSDTPDSDFGADRPEAIRQLGGPWKNYKMCVVTDFDEGDADPRGGFEGAQGSLGDSLAAVRDVSGPSSWCSNPYVEIDEGNARTNCMGCHQHGGTPLSTTDILGDEASFPDRGRTRLRKNFPADYTWVTRGNMELAKAMDDKVNALSPK